MIADIVQIIYGFLLILLLFLILKIVYFSLIKLAGEFKSFVGVIIEGSEYYWKWRWKSAHKKAKIEYRKIDNHHAGRAWTLIPNLRDKLHYGAVINSNSDGVRGSREKYSGKKAVFYGDSFCFGEGVDDDETIPAFFEKKSNIQSVNLGVHGYGIDQQYLYLKETLSKYKPALTCFIICDNNFRRNFMDFRDYAKPKFIIKNNKIVLTNIPVPKPEDCLKGQKISRDKIFLEFIKHLLIYYGLAGRKKRVKICDYILDRIKESADKANSELVFIYMSDVRRGFWYKSYIDRYFINYFKKRKIKYLYLEEIFGREKWDLKNIGTQFGTPLDKHLSKTIVAIYTKKED